MPSFACKVRNKQLSVNSNLSVTESVEEVISQKVLELRRDLAQGIQKTFKDVIDATSGDSSSCGQKSITFIRQVSALSCLPELLEDESFPDDVKTRTKLFIQKHARDKTGLEVVRRHVAEFIQNRDDCPADFNDVILVPGLSACVKIITKLLRLSFDGRPIGVMTPAPQYLPLTTLFAEHGLQLVQYPLVEKGDWSIDIEELENTLAQGKTFCNPKAILVVNPGHPTGHILTRTNIENVIQFADKEKLLIIACEIYQTAVHDDYEFMSFKKVTAEMSTPARNTELVSFMLYSGDFTNEPGLKIGFMELFNIDEQVKNHIKGSISTCDSPSMCSQVCLDCLVNPPRPHDPSYPLFCRDTEAFQTYAGVLARTVCNSLSRTPGLSCSPVRAGYCAVVKVDIPANAVVNANSRNISPSTFYVLEMLEQCGVVTEPGDKYGQSSGYYYFILSFLMPEEKLKKALTRIKEFHLNFMKKH